MNTQNEIPMKRCEYRTDTSRPYSETLRWLLVNYQKKTKLPWAYIARELGMNRTTLYMFRSKHSHDNPSLQFDNGMRLMNYLKTKEGFNGGFIDEPATTSL